VGDAAGGRAYGALRVPAGGRVCRTDAECARPGHVSPLVMDRATRVKPRLAARVTRQEWVWPLAFALAVMAFTSVPYLVGAASQNSNWRFGGFLLGADDGNSYLANMGEGAHGAWLFTLPYSTEPQRGVFLYSF